MDSDALTEIYDDGYAEAYDQRFLLDAWPKQGADFELSAIRGVLTPGGRWLDVGCGTGWFLSQLPEVERAGIDLSPAMVERARAANPDALFIEQRSFLDPVDEWQGEWDLVTCIWQPYNYVDSVVDVERLLDNMAAWTRPGGAVFIPVVDLEDLRPHVEVPYEAEPDVWGGSIALTSVTWTWHEPLTGKVHRHLVAPQAGHFVQHLASLFRKVEVLRYPPTERGGVSRKAVLATGRRGPDDDGAAATVAWHPAPAHPDELAERLAIVAAERARTAHEQEAADQLAEMLAENDRRWAENDEAWARANAHTWAETARAEAAEAECERLRSEVAAGHAEIAALHAENGHLHHLAARPSRAQLSKQPTSSLVRAAAGRLRPDRLARRMRRRRR